ncbi:MAG: DegT/DnrJ/EryC1/StrS family aminotransferase [Candidatus Baltobacteraceae bacterium]
MIPSLDLARQYAGIKEELDAAVANVLAGGVYINGPNVAAFEAEVGAYAGCRYAVGLNSGTDALLLGLRALGIGPGDEVITTPFTFAATSEAICNAGARVVFADIDPVTFDLDPAAVRAAITPRTRAILVVHLYGQPAAMDEMLDVAQRHHLAVVEDCAQSIGAAFGARPTGSFGAFGAVSFFPTKNLGACGDGGMVVTGDSALAQRVRRLRAHGAAAKYYHEELGVNSRLDELQAAILRVKLRHLEAWIERRRAIAARYVAALRGAAVEVPREAPNTRHAYHQFTVRVAGERDRVAGTMRGRGVQTSVYYPVPLHLQPVHADLHLREGAFPQAERAAREVLSLPIFPELAKEEVGGVAGALREAVRCAS